MQTGLQTETKTITQLPIMKYFDDAKLVQTGKESLKKWRKGEKPIGSIIGILLIGVIGYGTFKWIIPAVFGALSQVLAVIVSILAIVLVIFPSACYLQAFPQNCPLVSQSYHTLESVR